MARVGTVYLVGAGPGDPGLITVRGLRLLARADVVVYDRLVGQGLLGRRRAGAELVYAGKGRDGHTLRQEEINGLLVEKALEGKSVVRLKGGDPFVFGRGGEEADALAAASVPFEVVPGVTSAVAVPAYAGIPVTDRRHTSSFTVFTGQPGEGRDGVQAPAVDGTVVALMGVEGLAGVAAGLMARGLPADTPAALIERGTTPHQRALEAPLGEIARRAREAGVRPPAVLVAGSVVGMRAKLRWFETRPLHGLRVVVTRSPDQAGGLVEALEEMGAEAVELPCIAFQPPEDWGQVDAAIERLPSCGWVAFTSANGVSFFLDRLWTLGRDARLLQGVSVAAIGPASAEVLRSRGIRADLVAPESSARSLVEALGAALIPGERVLLPQSGIADDVLSSGLAERGALVERVVAYRTLPPADLPSRAAEALGGGADVVCFASPSAVRNLLAALGGGTHGLGGAAVACIGPRTAREAAVMGLGVDIQADEQSPGGLAEAIAAWRQSRGG